MRIPLMVLVFLWASTALGQRHYQADPRCTQHFPQQYGSTTPYSPPTASPQYTPAVPQASPLPDESIPQVAARTQQSTVWIAGLVEDRHFHMSGTVIGLDDTRGERRLLILTGNTGRNDVMAGFSRDDPGQKGTVLASGVLGLLEITSSKRPSYYMPLDQSPVGPGDKVFREGFVPDLTDGPHFDLKRICKVTPTVVEGDVVGYRKTMLIVESELKEGFMGGPVYTKDGLQAVTICVGGNSNQAHGISTLKVLDWIKSTRVRLDGHRYTLREQPSVVLPGPALVPVEPVRPESPATPPVDVDTPDPPAVVTPGPSDGLDELRARVKALEAKCNQEPDVTAIAAVLLAALKADTEFHQVVAGMVKVEPPTFPDHGPIAYEMYDPNGTLQATWFAGYAREPGEKVQFQLVPKAD